jgi:hypothetical protein
VFRHETRAGIVRESRFVSIEFWAQLGGVRRTFGGSPPERSVTGSYPAASGVAPGTGARAGTLGLIVAFRRSLLLAQSRHSLMMS